MKATYRSLHILGIHRAMNTVARLGRFSWFTVEVPLAENLQCQPHNKQISLTSGAEWYLCCRVADLVKRSLNQEP